VLFASGDVLTPARLAAVLDVPQDEIRAALAELQAEWSAREGAVDLVEIAGGFRFLTRPRFHDDLAGLARKGGVETLSPAALETLAIVAYRQPLTRAEIEAVRGVQAGPLLRVLLDRDLIRVSGRSSEPGHPLLYGTTKRFLDHFGLKSLKHLPDLKDLLD
jgi:segregation and condensation protein B